MVELGVDRLLSGRPDVLADERVGLVTNPSGVDSRLRPTASLLDDHGAVDLRRLFGPEHGVRGRARAGAAVPDGTDPATGLPVVSLYGGRRRPGAETLADLDVLAYDMQDVGARYYTFASTLGHVLAAAADADTRVVVLDRPNPVAPLGVSGNRVPDEHASFVGNYRLPVTHGLTVGELARYVVGEFGIDVDLAVVALSGWSRTDWYDETGLAWVPPSPNVPTPTTATLYPGTCLIEGTTLSEGRGTASPFELVGAPWIDGHEWARALNDLVLPGVRFRPAAFEPSCSKHAGEPVDGVQIHLRDRDAVDPLAVGVATLVSAFRRYPQTTFRRRDGEYVLDRLAGGPALRETIENRRDADVESVVAALQRGWVDDAAAFREAREPYEVYR